MPLLHIFLEPSQCIGLSHDCVSPATTVFPQPWLLLKVSPHSTAHPCDIFPNLSPSQPVFPLGIFTFKTFLMSPPLPAHMTYSFMSKALPLNSLQFFHSVSFLSALFNILNCNYAVSVIRRVNVMCIGHWWKDTAGKNRSTHRKIHCPFVDHQCHMDWPGSEPMAPQWHNGD